MYEINTMKKITTWVLKQPCIVLAFEHVLSLETTKMPFKQHPENQLLWFGLI